jgi:HEAT repeat protein
MAQNRNTTNSSAPERALALLRACALGLVLSTPCFAEASTSHESAPQPYGLERVLLELEATPQITADQLLDALIVAGPRALPELRAALDAGDESLSTPAREQYVRGLEALPSLVAKLVDPTREVSRLDAARTTLALDVLREEQPDGACLQALALVTPDALGAAPSSGLLRTFERTLSALLAEHPAELRALDELPEGTHPSLRLSIVRAVGAAPSREAATFLSDVMDADASLDLMVLAELGRVLEAIDEPCDPWVEQRILGHLDSQEVALRREACMTAGRVELFEAVPRLIELFEDQDAGVRESATWGLERITGKRMKAEPERWRAWHQAELEWWAHDASEAFASLRGGEPHEVAAAIRALSGHRHFRHQISEELCALLDREEGSLPAQACAALGALGSRRAIPRLIAALGDRSPGTVEAAHAALERITGRLDLPSDPAAWVAAGFGGDNLSNR